MSFSWVGKYMSMPPSASTMSVKLPKLSTT